MTRDSRMAALALASALILPFLAGCGRTMTMLPDTPERLARGHLYYLDGAGGGGLTNWSGGVKEGLLAAGYDGGAEMFGWETGLGVVADQDAGADYKRARAAEVARRIEEYKKLYPSAPVSLIGLSAGTAVAVFALEALPADAPVDTVVLLGASIGADYDLAQALRRVRNKLYIVTCGRDVVLGFLVPLVGTADRQSVEAAAGLNGFTLPAGATEETRRLYREKVVTIAWTRQLDPTRDCGTHLDNVSMEFIRDHVAPLLRQTKPPASLAPAFRAVIAPAGAETTTNGRPALSPAAD